MNNTTTLRIIATAFIILNAVIAQLKFGDIFGWRPDIVFASLIALTFFLSLFEFLAALLFAILLMNPGPLLAPEIVILLSIPLVPLLFSRIIFQFEGWLSLVLIIFIGLFGFYIILGTIIPIGDYGIVVKNAVVSSFAGLAVFGYLHYFYRERT